MTELEEVILAVDGLEALRLVEIEGLDQDQAAERMNVSRQTLGRILSAARQSIARAVVLGQALRIDGGNYVIRSGKCRRDSEGPARN